MKLDDVSVDRGIESIDGPAGEYGCGNARGPVGVETCADDTFELCFWGRPVKGDSAGKSRPWSARYAKLVSRHCGISWARGNRSFYETEARIRGREK